MKALLAAVVAATVLVAGPAAADEATSPLVVKLEPGVTVEELEEALGTEATLVVAEDTVVVDVPAGDVDVAEDHAVWALPDTEYRSAALPGDACFGGGCPAAPDGQPELAAVGAPAAWEVTTGSAQVLVAVLDTPADTAHPDLVGKVQSGPSFTRSNCFDPTPASHGTAVSGIVGAATDNGIGVASLGWQTSVVSVGVLDRCGVGSAAGIAAGIRWAADAGADVINLSLTGGSHPALQDAIEDVQDQGVLVVAAAGNSSSSTPVYPAAYPDVVAVGATDDGARGLAPFSNRGSWVDITAPGQSIYTTSTLDDGYRAYDGTSFSAPFVAAAAGLVLAARPGIGADEVVTRLRASATPLAGVAWGRLNAAGALVDPPGGYWLAAADGGVFAFGDATFRGSAGGRPLSAPVVGMASRTTGGYWLVGRDGGVFSFGGATFLGSTGGRRLNQPIVGMAATPSGLGYWLVAADGGIFAFGDAPFLGSTGAMRLNQPIVGMASTPSGRGYFLVARDGGIFTFGDATFRGSTGGRTLSAPIVAMAAPATGGYWLMAADGGVFSFGTAFFGSGAGAIETPVVAAVAEPDGRGYRLVTSGGSVLTFGSAGYRGSVTGRLIQPVVAMAAAPPTPA